MREAESGRAIQIYSAGKFDSNLFMEVARFSRILERAMGIEPTSEAWEALYKTLKAIDLAALSFPNQSLSWKLDGN